MDYKYDLEHHEPGQAANEVDVPEPHAPGAHPPRAKDGLSQESEALCDCLAEGDYFPALYADSYQDACGEKGCGCGDEPDTGCGGENR